MSALDMVDVGELVLPGGPIDRPSGIRLSEVARRRARVELPTMLGAPAVFSPRDMGRAVLVKHIIGQFARFDDDALRDVLIRLVATPSTQEVAA